MDWILDSKNWIVYTIILFWLYSIVPILFFIPLLFIFSNRIHFHHSCNCFTRIIGSIEQIIHRSRSILIVNILFGIFVYSLILYHNIHEYMLNFIEIILFQFGHTDKIDDDIEVFIFTVAAMTTQVLIPVSTLLAILTLYSASTLHNLKLMILGITMWFSFRIALTVTFMANMDLNLQDNIGTRAVFGSFNGLLLCCLLSVGFAVVCRFMLRHTKLTLQVLAIALCLSPVVALIWVSYDITIRWLTIDYMVSPLIFGWIVSSLNRSNRLDTPQNRDIRWTSATQDHYTHQLEWRRRISFALAASHWYSKIIRICLFVVLVIVPAILLKMAFHSTFQFRLDGSVESWMMIWAIASFLGCAAFLFSKLYELPNRAVELGVVAFLATFSIMIFNWNREFDEQLMAHQNQFSVVFTMPIVVLAIPTLIATVVIDKHRWTWSFWGCWIFIYIFVHSLAGSGYIKDLSKLDLFSWINMSVIVFVFLFAIPIYFASGLRRKLDGKDSINSYPPKDPLAHAEPADS